MPFGKLLLLTLLLVVAIGCRQDQGNAGTGGDAGLTVLQKQVDSLSAEITQLRHIAIPKLSVLMNRLQLHHSRMWEPGVRKNWKLAAYEFSKTNDAIAEITGIYGDMKHGNTNLKLEMAEFSGTMDSLENAIKGGVKDDFVNSYQSLTRKCNSCHQKAALDFYEVISPKTAAYSSEIE